MVVALCVLLLAVSWLAAITAKSDTAKQKELIRQASAYTEDEIYILAEPLLEEAASYSGKYTLEAEEALKQVYLNLTNNSGYVRKYESLLDKQMARKNAGPEVFKEAAAYYSEAGNEKQAISILKQGAEKTENEELRALYEENRYQFSYEQATYQDVTTICNGAIQVNEDGKWGLANRTGAIIIPCEYERISSYSDDRAIVKKDDVISAVDKGDNRVALLHENAEDFTNFNENRLGVKLEKGWVLSGGSFGLGETVFEELGVFSNEYAPAKTNGKWGLVDKSGEEWLIEPEYDAIAQDELGRAYAQEAAFVKKGETYLLWVDGEIIGSGYEEARPFEDGWAAVKQNGTWGFVDTEGTIQIPFQFDDALSFSNGLAAVKQDSHWGYIKSSGEVVIEPVFLEAKSFYKGSAPVKTSDGWRFITRLEFKEENKNVF